MQDHSAYHERFSCTQSILRMMGQNWNLLSKAWKRTLCWVGDSPPACIHYQKNFFWAFMTVSRFNTYSPTLHSRLGSPFFGPCTHSQIHPPPAPPLHCSFTITYPSTALFWFFIYTLCSTRIHFLLTYFVSLCVFIPDLSVLIETYWITTADLLSRI